MDKKYPGAYRALQQVAKQQGTTLEHIIEEINKSIRIAYADAVRIGDMAAIERWKQIPSEGVLPNALELVEYIGLQVMFESNFS